MIDTGPNTFKGSLTDTAGDHESVRGCETRRCGSAAGRGDGCGLWRAEAQFEALTGVFCRGQAVRRYSLIRPPSTWWRRIGV
jgi:hypothetical protein